MSDAHAAPDAGDPATQALVALVLAGLRRPLDPGEEQQLDLLIGTVPDGRAIADKVVERWLMTGMLDRRDLSDGDEDHLHGPAGGSDAPGMFGRIMPRRQLLRMAGAAVAAGMVGVAGYRGWQAVRPGVPGGEERIITASGAGRSQARLLDGSSVTLSRNARIASRMSADERRVRHLSGEAYYHVARDTARPFVVEAGGYSLTALGTGFNVDPLGDGVCVDLLEGRLRIERLDGGRALILTAGQRFVGGADVRVMHADPDVAAWSDGRLVFDDVSLADVARRLGNHSDVALIPGSPAVAGLRFSGVMDVDTPRAWRLGLQAALPVRVTPRDDGLHVDMNR